MALMELPCVGPADQYPADPRALQERRFCHNMTGNQSNLWGQRDLNRMCFGLSADMEHNLTEPQQQMTKDLNCNTSISLPPLYPDTFHQTSDNTPGVHEGDQVVPSAQKRTASGGHQRKAKPLPPLPDPEDPMSDEAADSEVEFFTSDQRRLLPKSCPKAICRGTNRDYGQVNYAFQESLLPTDGAGIGSMAFSWPGREDRPSVGANIWSLALQRDDHHQHVLSDTSCSRDLQQSSRLRVSSSGHAARPLYSSDATRPTDRPRVPPRVPIPPKPAALSKTVGANEDRPPKIPPRVPLVPPCPPRTPSPKSLPIYINGVMPATQSFAANPKYVSKALQRQQSERAPTAAQFSPCIVPIVKDGRQASSTHYILLPPGRPAHSERRDRLLSEPSRTGNGSGVWQNR